MKEIKKHRPTKESFLNIGGFNKKNISSSHSSFDIVRSEAKTRDYINVFDNLTIADNSSINTSSVSFPVSSFYDRRNSRQPKCNLSNFSDECGLDISYSTCTGDSSIKQSSNNSTFEIDDDFFDARSMISNQTCFTKLNLKSSEDISVLPSSSASTKLIRRTEVHDYDPLDSCITDTSRVDTSDILSITSEEVSPIVNKSDSVSNKINSKANCLIQIVRKIIYMIINFLKAMLISFLVLAIGILLISSFSDINHECSVDKSIILSFDNIYENMTKCIHGQNQSLVHVAKVVENFQLNSQDQFLWIVGPIGVGKSKTVNILKNILSNMKVILLYASLLPTLPDVLTSETQELVHKFDLCVPNVIVIDEFDSENNFISIQNYIKKLLFELNVSNRKPKLLFIVIGSFKQELVFDSYISHINSKNSRNNFHMQNIIDNLSLTDVMKTFYKTFHIDYSVVPFLPLEKEQLKHCIVLEINRLVNKEHCSINETKFIKALQKYNISFEILFKDIFTMSNLRVNKHFRKTGTGTNIVSSGCKRVYSLLQVFLFNQT